MNDVIKGLFERKSVRVYSDEMIEEDKKKLIIDAAIQAPTAGNMTSYSIIDVEDQEIKEKLAINGWLSQDFASFYFIY